MESCSLYKSLQKLVHLEGRVDISKVIMKKPYPGHLLIFVHNGKAALAEVHLCKTVEKLKLKDVLLSRKKFNAMCKTYRH